MTASPEMPRLCGGVFFDLLVGARRSRQKSRNSFNGESDGLSQVNCLKQLIRVFNPEYPDPYEETFSTNVTDYKKCRLSSNTYLPFDDETAINIFDEEVQTNFSEPLRRMMGFADTFFALTGKGAKLCESLIALIAIDSTIGDDEEFFALPTGNKIKKKDLIRAKYIYWPSLLVGVWHFILTKRPDNTIGKNTVEDLDNKVAPWVNRGFLDGITGFVKREYVYDPGDFRRSPHIDELEEPNVTPRPEPKADYSEYINGVLKKYGTINTLLYNDAAHPFYEFYVPNNIYLLARITAEGYPRMMHHTIEKPDIVEIEKYSQFALLTGTGGLGKSMMMRHLLLNTASRANELNLIPVLIPLKDYGRKDKNIVNIAYELVCNFSSSIRKEDFENDLQAGNIVLLLDGLDEVSTSLRAEFDNGLSAFTNDFDKAICVVSSRPFSTFSYLNCFTVFELCPFNKPQAIELIEKLDFRPDDLSIKEKFKEELDNRLYDTHNDFARNPLLLTIMLMTYEQYAEVPSKMHIFYQEAYATLSQKHDASKGAYKRALKTGLTADRFADYFAEFCAKTYLKEKFELTRGEIEEVYNNLKVKQKDNISATADDFIFDLVSNLCLMYYEDGKYQFTHRSFQEYFCAVCFSKWKDRNLRKVGEFFETQRNRGDEDLTFHMLHDMIPEKVEEEIFLPFLKKLFAKCDTGNGYWTFLETIYPEISYVTGDVSAHERYENERASYIYNFIASEEGLNKGENIEHLQLPYIESLRVGELVAIDMKMDRPAIVLKELNDKEDSDPFFSRYGVFQHVGWVHEFKMRDVLRHKENFTALLSALDVDEFPLKKEYNSMKRYLYEMENLLTTPGDDLFDLF